jgi:hypothetical protein
LTSALSTFSSCPRIFLYFSDDNDSTDDGRRMTDDNDELEVDEEYRG